MMRIALLAFFAFAAAALAAPPCTPEASWTLEPDWYGGMTVPVAVEGKHLSLLVDTGGVRSMLTGSAVADLNLTPRPIRNERVTLYGGLQVTHWVRVDGAGMPDQFWVMPDARVPYALSGTLAPDFLSRYDVGFDFAHARMRLYAPGACPAGNAIPLKPDRTRHLIVTVMLDGKPIDAMLDTGASRSDFSLETARALFGTALREQPAERADCERGVSTHAFRQISIGGVTINDPDIVLVPDAIGGRPADSPRLVLGMGILRRLHLTVFYSRNRLAVARATP
ncbi:aspartyl protease family protein [Rhizomicrobium electricum]|uniref:Peptidase A2 domain-containing protein n=1 Tax=Rhizomicrobium electricum TaxID=480070 RepID=A0ABN1F642_9PROT|nr:aspartyl protease family protein [Rhizomicrobium electricum]NIJ50472.1 putative aspartyl protease [Rhizomicrobium electricum]